KRRKSRAIFPYALDARDFEDRTHQAVAKLLALCHRGTMAIVLLDRKRSSIRACAERSLGFSAGSCIGSICFATPLTTGFGFPPASERHYRPLKLESIAGNLALADAIFADVGLLGALEAYADIALERFGIVERTSRIVRQTVGRSLGFWRRFFRHAA